MAFDRHLDLIEKSTDPKEKRKLFDHLENLFSLQNNLSQLFALKISRLDFELKENNIIELENEVSKTVKSKLGFNLNPYIEFLLAHYTKGGNAGKVRDLLEMKLKNSLSTKRNSGLVEITQKYEKILSEDLKLYELLIRNLFEQKNYKTLLHLIAKNGFSGTLFNYEESIGELAHFKVLFIDALTSFNISRKEKINVSLAKDLVINTSFDDRSLRYLGKAILLSFDGMLVDDFIVFLNRDKSRTQIVNEINACKKNYIVEMRTRIDLGKDLLNYTSFSKIKKINDSQILRNLGEETRAVNLHELNKVVDSDATRFMNSSEPTKEHPRTPSKKAILDDTKELFVASNGSQQLLEDLVCAHLFVGQFHAASKMISESLKNMEDLNSEEVVNLNYYKILCLIKIGDFNYAMQLVNEYLNELDITNHQYSTFTYLKYLVYLEIGDLNRAEQIKNDLSRRDPSFKKISGRLL